MTDRELLELAARAAGIGPVVWGEKFKLGDDEIDCTDMPYIPSGQPDENPAYWNPLVDDSDALRLAVKLQMQVVIADDETWAATQEIPVFSETVAEPHNGDHYAATRRAIVRAAAEIGRNMK